MKNIQVKKDHYFSLRYDTKQRWVSYWYQINAVLESEPKNVLEIGIGNKIVSNYIRNLGINITTCDFDKSLSPDVVADVRTLPFKRNSFDVVLCAEVLEHLPFKYFSKSIEQIFKVSKNIAVITLPHFSLTNLYFGFKLIPFISLRNLSLKIDVPLRHKFVGEHYWEIGKRNYSISKIKKNITRSGFTIKKSFYPYENPYHHFFILKK